MDNNNNQVKSSNNDEVSIFLKIIDKSPTQCILSKKEY